MIGTAQHTETLERFVVYKELYGGRRIWIRPLENFLEELKRNGEMVKRFEFIED